MLRQILVVAGLAILGLSASQGATLDSWSFNGENLVPDSGTATMEATWIGAGLGTLTYATGTEVGAAEGVEAGWSLAFLDVLTGFSEHEVLIRGLDLSGQNLLSLSFALRSDEIFELGESAEVSYRIGQGEWEGTQILALPESEWTLRSFNFVLPETDLSEFSLRIRHHAVFDAGKVLSFDNVTVAAVPEPSTFLLALAGLLVAGMRLLRRDQMAGSRLEKGNRS